MTLALRELSREAITRSYVVHDVACSATAPAEYIEVVDQMYGAFAVGTPPPGAYRVWLADAGGDLVVADSEQRSRSCRDEVDAALAIVESIAHRVLARLAARGVYAVHAATVSHDGRALSLCGRSGSGKSTLALALVARGFGLLSDEFALLMPEGRSVLPYHRGVHIRPGTPELVEPLGFLKGRPFHPLGGGFQWTLATSELEEVFPSCLTGPAELDHLVFLEPSGNGESTLEPFSPGLATVELARATAAAATDLDAVLERMGGLVAQTPCWRLRSGRLESSLDLLGELCGRDEHV